MTRTRAEERPVPPEGSGGAGLSRETALDLAEQRVAESREKLAQAMARGSQPGNTTDAAAAALASLVRKHPFVAVGAAVALGALVVRVTPWRSLRHPALVAALGPALISVVQSRPGSMWLDLLMTGYQAMTKPDK